ncbi:hypothetical protein LC55x_4137 [Lysobacter capsici]|nr:hypothetical protein LC55x_4137 [Lysobacter capsici]
MRRLRCRRGVRATPRSFTRRGPRVAPIRVIPMHEAGRPHSIPTRLRRAIECGAGAMSMRARPPRIPIPVASAPVAAPWTALRRHRRIDAQRLRALDSRCEIDAASDLRDASCRPPFHRRHRRRIVVSGARPGGCCAPSIIEAFGLVHREKVDAIKRTALRMPGTITGAHALRVSHTHRQKRAHRPCARATISVAL